MRLFGCFRHLLHAEGVTREQLKEAFSEEAVLPLRMMDEKDFADLGLSKGARVKLREHLRKNFASSYAH